MSDYQQGLSDAVEIIKTIHDYWKPLGHGYEAYVLKQAMDEIVIVMGNCHA